VRVGIISDIHANLAALEAVLADLGSVDALWCLGDVVGYGPDPNECVNRLRELEAVCIAGNHDWAALGKLPIHDFNDDAANAVRWTQRTLEPDARAWLEDLPQIVDRDPITLAHGSPREPIWEYVLSGAVAKANVPHFETLGCLVGHTHVPSSFVQQPDGRVQVDHREPGQVLALGHERFLANPGSVGQPRDQDPRAAYMIYDTDAATLTWRRVEYPIPETQAKMRRAGLPGWLSQRLTQGR
jgi:predicted phosphodiesterase